MSDRGLLSVPHDTRTSQARASDPDYSIWVEANAGSGKTYVLTHRVLRLLLADVRPQSILCLTYTKAAAAEMRKRVGARLAVWAVADSAALAKDIEDLIGRAPDEDMLKSARTLFARALETPGGLRILTIHAFCEAVLHRFPIEAGVPFDFAVIEEDRQEQMILAAREAVLAEGLRGGDHAQAVETLFGLLSDDSITSAIDAALSEGARLKPLLADITGAKSRLRALVNYRMPSGDAAASIVRDSLLTPDRLRLILARCKAKPDGDGCVDLLALLDPDHPEPGLLRRAFFTKTGSPRKKLLLKAEQDANPDIAQLLGEEQERLVAIEAEVNAALLVERSEAILDILAAIRARYEAQKQRHSLLDFDDLIEKLGDLFADRDIGPWVQYKLDAGIDHILVDESQDTNARQWRVVRALADEFFAGDGAVTRPRSVFAVGDQKQSIYSFQGAQPVLFGETGRDVARKALAAGKNFADVRLHTSFRTLPGILSAVDRVCAREDIRAALLSSDPIGHEPARTQGGGVVTLWPPVEATKDVRDTGNWPVEPVDADPGPERVLANRIAREISEWVTTGRPLGERGRPVAAEDVLILVQKRSRLFHEIIRALRAQGLPTPGADRLAVTGHIAVLDLLALIDVLLNTADDLQLAALLRSPLFDFSEDDLYAIAVDRPRGQTLWSALFAAQTGAARDAAERLGRWRSGLDMERPFEFLAGVLYAEGGLRRFHARLGGEVDELLSEFLDLALAHEQSEQPSLQGFAAEMRRRSVTIKRELAEAGGGVRVMTVHGAKGLEAPIVILADATARPTTRQLGKPVYVLTEAPGPLLIHGSSKGQHTEETAAIRDAIDATRAEEYWRLLYVAMTRAEDELFVTGTLPATKDAANAASKLEGSWYHAVEMGLSADLLTLKDETGAIGALVYPALAETRETLALPAEPRPLLEPLALDPVPPPPTVKLVSPSLAGKGERKPMTPTLAEQVRDAEAARQEGLALHALLQHLAAIAPADRVQVAHRALETLLPETPQVHESLVSRALSILTRPDLAHLFGKDSRAEVPFLVDARQNGEAVRLSGRIDRLVVSDSHVLVVDYKSDANVPTDVSGIPPAYVTQLGLYALVAHQLFPGRTVAAAILWTGLESLMNLPQALLDGAHAGITIS